MTNLEKHMKPERMTLDQLEHVNDIAFLGLVNRLKSYAGIMAQRRDELSKDMWVDLTTAANIIDFVARSRDDHK